MKIDWSKISELEYLQVALQLVHECQMCGGCCQRMQAIAYNAVDAERMAKHLNMKKNDWMREMTTASGKKQGDRWLKLVGEEQRCPYLTDHGCSQYAGRGQVCRNYPWISAERLTAIRAGHRGLQLYPKCPGMPATLKKYMEASFAMDQATAQSILKSDLKKYCYLYMVENEGRGEAARYAAKELGLEDVPEEDSLKGMARAVVIASFANTPVEIRTAILKQLTEELKIE